MRISHVNIRIEQNSRKSRLENLFFYDDRLTDLLYFNYLEGTFNNSQGCWQKTRDFLRNSKNVVYVQDGEHVYQYRH